jgi:spore coat protein U-like protein
MKRLISCAALAASALVLGIASTNATTYDTKQLQVQVNVANACAITNLQNIQFNSILANQTTTQDQDASANLQVTCSGTYNVNADAGQNAGGDITKRAMKSSVSSDLIAYNLYTDYYTTVWGNTPGTNTFSTTGNGYFWIYAKIPAGATPKDSSSYTDIVTVTVTN